ncbi:hypothetical protein ACQP2H_24170 [Micromonospora sp. CA-248260]|uniref:hypothetical protein n=1 Tax=Micromonospora sp. CA-248260 TaxID=3239962 RepID=UPI003D8F7DDC
MTTAEKINAAIAVIAALGVGSALTVLVGHLLSRRERKVNVAEKFVQMATALTEGLNDQLVRVQEELTEAKRENAELRAELESTRAATTVDSERLRSLERKAHSTSSALDHAADELNAVQLGVRQEFSSESVDLFIKRFLKEHGSLEVPLLHVNIANAGRKRRGDASPDDPAGGRQE